MPAQIPMPVMPDWCFHPKHSKNEIRDDPADIQATVPATDPAGGYPMLGGTMQPGIVSQTAADNTIMLGVAVFGKLTTSQLRTAEGNLPSTIRPRDRAHNGFVSDFHKLIEGSDNPMYSLINETVQIHDAEVCLHNLGCAVAAARIANQPETVTRLMGIINKFVGMVVYEIDLLREQLGRNEPSGLAAKAAGLIKGSYPQDHYHIQEETARLKKVQVRLGMPFSATAAHIMPLQTIYLRMGKTDRYDFWKSGENRDFIYSFYNFARGPMNLGATFSRNPFFEKYALEMFASFCDNGYRMVIGIEKCNERLSTEFGRVFMRSMKKSMTQPDREIHQKRHHEFNAYYNEKVRLAGHPEEQITDIDSIYVDKYVRNDNVLKRGTKTVSRPQQTVLDPAFTMDVPAYDG